MKKTFLIAGAMLVLSAAVASAQGGMNLAWNDCGAAGLSSTIFNCGSNSGLPFTMVTSFMPPSGVNEFLGMGCQLDITSTNATVSDWWKHGVGQCRGTGALTVSLDFTSGPFTCIDFWAGGALSGSSYDIGYGSPNRCRLLIQGAVPFDNRGPLDSSTEYYGCKVNLLRSKSTGTGACAGCTDPACIVLNEFDLFQPAAVNNDPVITTPLLSNYVTWQASSIPGCPASTPTHNSSWGQVKSLYR